LGRERSASDIGAKEDDVPAQPARGMADPLSKSSAFLASLPARPSVVPHDG